MNGALVGGHEGGHTAWFADVTKALGAGGRIAVVIDNRPGLGTIPGWAMKLQGGGNVWYDWWHYGGIVRDVSLVAQERALVRRQTIRTSLAGGSGHGHDERCRSRARAPCGCSAASSARAASRSPPARRR